jgi:hypothetical protein
MSNPTPSPLSASCQRDDALERANWVRHERRLLREKIRRLAPPDGAALAARVLINPPAFAQTMTVARLLTAVHGVGKPRAKEIAGQRVTRRLGAVSARERERIAAECQRRAAHLKTLNVTVRTDRDQALRALECANRVRIARARSLGELAEAASRANAAFRAAALISNPKRPVELDGLTVKAVVEAIPRVHTSTARPFMRRLALSDSTTLGMLSRSRAITVATALIENYGQGHDAVLLATGDVTGDAGRELLAA